MYFSVTRSHKKYFFENMSKSNVYKKLMTLSPKNAKMIPVVKKEVFRLKTDWKKELPAALLAGGICGVIVLMALVFLAPEKWYMAFPAAAVMAAAALYKTVSDKEKNARKYKRDEHLVTMPWFASAEGFIRKDSDRPAKFYFGEDGITSIRYKNVKPIVEFIPKEKITGRGTDRCGWISFIVPEEKFRIVIPKENAENLVENLTKNGWE